VRGVRALLSRYFHQQDHENLHTSSSPVSGASDPGVDSDVAHVLAEIPRAAAAATAELRACVAEVPRGLF